MASMGVALGAWYSFLWTWGVVFYVFGSDVFTSGNQGKPSQSDVEGGIS